MLHFYRSTNESTEIPKEVSVKKQRGEARPNRRSRSLFVTPHGLGIEDTSVQLPKQPALPGKNGR
jgi:hypothetical protein